MRAEVPTGVKGLVDAAVQGPAVDAAICDGGRLVNLRPRREPTVRGITARKVFVTGSLHRPELLQTVRRLAAGGVVSPRIAEVLPASAAAEAHRVLGRGGVGGRIVLRF